MTEELLPFCECGCGLRVTKSGNRFIHGHHQRGVKHSPECNARQSERMMEHVVSDETRAAMSAARTGISPSQKHRAALSESLKNSDAAKLLLIKGLVGMTLSNIISFMITTTLINIRLKLRDLIISRIIYG